jgi:hypothetical protein
VAQTKSHRCVARPDARSAAGAVGAPEAASSPATAESESCGLAPRAIIIFPALYPGFDRAAFHERFDHDIVAFFTRTLR